MKFYGWSVSQINEAVTACLGDYPDLRFDVTKCWSTGKGPRVTGVLRLESGLSAGARMSRSGSRRTNSANWQVHWDFMYALFLMQPAGRIQTMEADYHGVVDFLTKAGNVAKKPAGERDIAGGSFDYTTTFGQL